MRIKQIPEYPNYYCRDNGVIYSNIIKGCRIDKNIETSRDEFLPLKPRYTKRGYARVYLRDNVTNKRKDVYIHRIVATLFCKHDDPFQNEVNHLDCNPKNNNFENLEWVSGKENKDYALTNGNMGRDEFGRFKHK